MDINSNEYYVYGLINPTTKEVFYIGKGKGNRAEQHLKEKKIIGQGNDSKIDKIQEILDANNEVKIIYYIRNVNEEAAFFLEEILIDRIGRSYLKGYVVLDGNSVLVPYGPLTNLLDGGLNEYNKISRTKLRTLDEIDKGKISIEFAVGKYPELRDVINSVPRTTREDEIKDTKRQTEMHIMQLIQSVDSDIFSDLNATKIMGGKSPDGRVISFECKYGRCEIGLGDEMEANWLDFLKRRGKTAEASKREFVNTAYVYIMENGKRIYEVKNLAVTEISKKLREFIQSSSL